jgi:DNA-binding CsgD family transcriptional regulator
VEVRWPPAAAVVRSLLGVGATVGTRKLARGKTARSDAPLSERALAAALDRLDNAAFVARRDGRWDFASTTGRSTSAAAPAATRAAIAGAIARFEAGARSRDVVAVAGLPRRWLVVLPLASGDRFASACAAWRLTARQAEVLLQIAAGEPNKTIAERLGCTEATVEAHATAIYRKARVGGRIALIAKLLALGAQ